MSTDGDPGSQESAPEEATDQPEAETPETPPRTTKGWVRTLLWIVLAAAAGSIGAGVVPWAWNKIHTHEVVAEADVDVITSTNFAGGEYLLPHPIQDVGPPPTEANSCEGRYAWAHGKGAVDANVTNFRVSITALEGHGVQVIGARRVALERSPGSPLVGSVVTCPGRGAEPVNLIQFDLDSGQSVYLDGDHPEGTDLNVPVAGGETQVFDVTAGTDASSWVYDVELVLRVDGKEVIERIDNDGRHFRTSASSNAKRYQRIDGQWVDVDSGGPPPVDMPVTVPDACTLLVPSDLDAVVGGQFEQRTAFPARPGPTDTGATAVTTLCGWDNAEQESVQLVLGDSPTPEQARAEYDHQVEVITDQGVTAEDLDGYVDVTLLSNGSVIALRGTRTVMVSIVRSDNRTEPFDRSKLQTLLDETLNNLANG